MEVSWSNGESAEGRAAHNYVSWSNDEEHETRPTGRVRAMNTMSILCHTCS